MKILRIPLVVVLIVAAARTFTANAQTVTETTLHSFFGYPTDGSDPVAGLVQGTNGNFYGATPYGGIDDVGIVFRITPSGSYTDLYSFGSLGAESYAGLVQGTNGNFYGTTTLGGTASDGTVFWITPSGTYSNLHSFAGPPTDGANPYAGLVQDTDGNLYGATRLGGPSTNCSGGCGTVFRISPTGSFTNLHFFTGAPADGSEPLGDLVQGSDGNFYGTTEFGGTNYEGTVFRISPSGTETTLYSFAGAPDDGAEPYAGLVQGSDSNFYGTTTKGGPSTNCFDGCGTVFRISPSGSEAVLYSFVGHPTDGADPFDGLALGSDGNFYGTTVNGGPNTNFDAATGLTGYGTVFRISPSGSYTTLHSFASSPTDGLNPEAGLVQGTDGNFYGTTIGGGTSTNFNPDTGDTGYGTVFKLDVGLGSISSNCTFSITPTNAVFYADGGSDSVSVTAPDGCDWSATNNDSFITITSGGSGSGDGTVDYSVAANTNPSEQIGTMTIAGQTYTVLEGGTSCEYMLPATSTNVAAGGGDGTVNVTAGSGCPWMAASNSGFITITSGSTGSGDGVVNYTVSANSNTVSQTGSMTIAGQTYTVMEGASSCEYTLSATSTNVAAGGGDGTVNVTAGSGCPWMAASNSGFITITSGSSGSGDGTVSYSMEVNSNAVSQTGSMTIAGQTFTVNEAAAPVTVTVLYSFAGSPTDGELPFAGLAQNSGGYLYGTTSEGGTSGNYGTVFLISPDGNETTIYSFVGYEANAAYDPVAGLVLGSDGNFYGTTQYGGFNGGTVFRISPGGSYTSLYAFAGSPTDGYTPVAGLVQGSDSNFYGTTEYGGTSTNCFNGCGTVFRIFPSGGEQVLYSFGSSPHDGVDPDAGLVQGSDGNFYGTTAEGGTSASGIVFRISPSGGYTNLHSFGSSPHDGANPDAGLVQGSDSNFYGTTEYGGAHGKGTVFRISPSGSYTLLYSFVGSPTDGSDPVAGLVQGSDGNFYGTTEYGGTSTNCSDGCGTVFRISPTGSYTLLYSFVGYPTDGANPLAGLVQDIDGNFYGTTVYGGTNGVGSVFKLDVGLGPISSNCTFSIYPTNAVFGAAGGSDSVSVTASNGCDWLATSNDGFITITSDSSGSGNGPVRYTVAANTSTNDLTGTMTIAGQTFTVTESGATSSGGGCTFSIGTKTSITLTAKGGSKSVSVKTKGTDCAWTAVSNDPFITITDGTSGTGNGKVVYSVPGNTNTTALSGTMTIAGETYTVNQDAGGCTFKLSPKAGKLKATGGTATIKVTPNLSDCDWTAVSDDGFITITGGASGTGKGAVSYSVPANATTNILTGTISVAGQTFTVTQAGAK